MRRIAVFPVYLQCVLLCCLLLSALPYNINVYIESCLVHEGNMHVRSA